MKLFKATWTRSNQIDEYQHSEYFVAKGFADVEQKCPSAEVIVIIQDRIETL